MNRRILVVHGEVAMRGTIARLARIMADGNPLPFGVVVEIGSSAEAQEALRVGGNDIDLVIADADEDGLALRRAADPKLPFVLLTDGMPAPPVEGACTSTLVKPFGADGFRAAVLPLLRPTVLVIDDDADLRGAVVDGLGGAFGEGARVIASGDADLAVARMREARVDAILSDLELPGTSGLELVRKMRRAGMKTPFLLLTACADEAYLQRAAAHESFGLRAKPCGFGEIIPWLRAAISPPAGP